MATLYFEAESEDDLRKVGYSKERRVDPQIVVGLLVDRSGLPLEIGCYEGNTAETTTIVPVITSFLQRHGLADTPMVVAADAGMLSASNLKALDELGLSFIVGSRTTKAPGNLESHSIGTVTFSPTGRSSTPSHPGTATRKSTTPRCAPSRSGTPTPILGRGGRSGRTQPNAHGATRRPWLPKKHAPGPSSGATRGPNQRGSSKSAAMTAASTRPAWPAHSPSSGSKAM